ncbi:GNAT family N-acetyltransferase [uncultured Bdellovibrio sp.]|uniref:GNAT family N-acetyltransferase n=1 Tax=Bdellovibrio sp. HCB-162 TaxID=3394234 RepID=UPI0025FF3701|nr:GNAT family N-acetyltransferase [uncultured Bdellovibrio sp.]
MEKLEKKPFADALQGSRIQLVISSPKYTQQVFDYIQRDHNLGGVNYSWVESLEDVAKHITTTPEENFQEINYLILKENIAIGSIHIHTISYSDHKAEVGYGIEKGEEGKGFVSEALQLVLSEMKRLGFNKAVINCDRENSRSISVAKRNGFSYEGLLLQDCIENGRFRDSMIFGKLLR